MFITFTLLKNFYNVTKIKGFYYFYVSEIKTKTLYFFYNLKRLNKYFLMNTYSKIRC